MQGKIALEEHFAPPAAFDARLQYFSNRLPMWPVLEKRQEGTFDIGLAEMDRSGVELTIVSLGAPTIQAILDPKEAAEAARRANDYLKQKVDQRPDRFAAFAAVPLQDPEAAAKELARCVKELGFKGALVNGFSQLREQDSGVYYDLPRFLPFWQTVQSLDVPFYLHPRNPMASQLRIYEGHPWLQGSAWAFGVETATHSLRLMCSGLFDKCPRLKIILGHLGEGLPSGIWRVEHRVKKSGERIPAEKPLSEYFRRNFYLTTSGNFHDGTLLAAMREVGADRILFSADYPFEDMDEAAQWFDRAPLSETDRMKIGRQNAVELFGLK
ncbi:MAG: amidohydrolase [Betaproteobacteria bacterium RIFCSPLOWO2_02_FULL_65_24]|nr:MAG: amidohydrolase [Betaproteobacteria bacterium RIFCSPLOWO2_02_FULL_65_24]OGA32480.1 MAG: amidohydrolase [Betaproteobacteria bacterium RIFCSPLOWO2_12_FULL_62_13b]